MQKQVLYTLYRSVGLDQLRAPEINAHRSHPALQA